MGNGKAALKDLDKALKLDPNFVIPRMFRLDLWFESASKTDAEIHAECLTLFDRVH